MTTEVTYAMPDKIQARECYGISWRISEANVETKTLCYCASEQLAEEAVRTIGNHQGQIVVYKDKPTFIGVPPTPQGEYKITFPTLCPDIDVCRNLSQVIKYLEDQAKE